MEPHAKALADLAAAIFALEAKVDAMFPDILEPKQGRPSVERAVDALQVEVGDPRAHTATSHGDIHGASHAVPDNAASSAIVAEVPAITGSELKPDIPFQIAGVTTVALLHEGVPELAAEPAALHCLPSSTNTDKESLEVAPSACTSSITTAPAPCSTYGVPQLEMDVPALGASCSSSPIEYAFNTNSFHVAVVPRAVTGVILAVSAPAVSAPTVQLQQLNSHSELVMPSFSQRITSTVTVHRPMPWPSFMGVHANGDEARPRPWPSFRGIIGVECSGDAIMKQSRQCSSDSSRAKSCAAIEFPILVLGGNPFTSTGCIIIEDMCIPSVLRCLGAMSCTEITGRSASSYVQPSSAIRIASYGPGYFVTGRLMQVTMACSTWQLFLRSSSLIFTWVTFLMCTREPYAMLLYSFELSGAKLVGMLHEFENWWSYMENLQLLVLTWASEQEAVRSDFQFHCIILEDLHLHNQGLLATMLLFYSFKYHLWADKWRPRFVWLWHAYASLVWLLYNILLAMVCILEFLSNDSTLRTALLDSSAAWHCEYWMLDTFDCMSSSLMAGGFSGMANAQADLSQVLMDGSFLQRWTCKQLCHPAAESTTSDAFRFDDKNHARDAIMKPSRRCTLGDSSTTTLADVMEFQVPGYTGNRCTRTSGTAIHDKCGSNELRCLNGVLLFLENCGSASEYVQSVHTAPVWPPGSIPELPLWVIVSSSELKQFSQGDAPINLLTFSLLPLSESCCCLILNLDMHMSITLSDPSSSFHANIVMLSFCGKTHQMGHLVPVASSMFWDPELPILAICEVRLLNLQDLMPMLIAWSPHAQVGFATKELLNEGILSCCFFYWYHGRPSLSMFLAFDTQRVFQGWRFAVISIIRHLTLDHYIEYLDCLSYNGLKVLQVPWDPGVCHVLLSAGLRASRMLRRGECYGRCHYLGYAGTRSRNGRHRTTATPKPSRAPAQPTIPVRPGPLGTDLLKL